MRTERKKPYHGATFTVSKDYKVNIFGDMKSPPRLICLRKVYN